MVEKNPYFGATFAERKAIRLAREKAEPDAKAVSKDEAEVEDKAVKRAVKKAAPRGKQSE